MSKDTVQLLRRLTGTEDPTYIKEIAEEAAQAILWLRENVHRETMRRLDYDTVYRHSAQEIKALVRGSSQTRVELD